jgi:hypothetical protein
MWLGGLPLSSLQHPVASLFLGITNLSQFTQNSPGVTPENSVCWETLNPGDPPFGKGKVGFEVVFLGGAMEYLICFILPRNWQEHGFPKPNLESMTWGSGGQDGTCLGQLCLAQAVVIGGPRQGSLT